MIKIGECLGSQLNYCEGYGNPGASGQGYILGLALGVAQTQSQLGHPGSSTLDEINAFDKAEASDTYLGQINMITVSSFCGPNGLILGYDLLRSESLFQKHPAIADRRNKTKIYSAAALIASTRGLFGTIKEKHYPLLPGSHVPCAQRTYTTFGPKHIYGALALAIPEDREKSASLMMEDVGLIKSHINSNRQLILERLVDSIHAVGKNQGITYPEVFVEIKDLEIHQGAIGCALIAAPYFTLARKIASGKKGRGFRTMSLEEWLKNS